MSPLSVREMVSWLDGECKVISLIARNREDVAKKVMQANNRAKCTR